MPGAFSACLSIASTHPQDSEASTLHNRLLAGYESKAIKSNCKLRQQPRHYKRLRSLPMKPNLKQIKWCRSLIALTYKQLRTSSRDEGMLRAVRKQSTSLSTSLTSLSPSPWETQECGRRQRKEMKCTAYQKKERTRSRPCFLPVGNSKNKTLDFWYSVMLRDIIKRRYISLVKLLTA